MTGKIRSNVASFPDVRRALADISVAIERLHRELLRTRATAMVALNAPASHVLREDGDYLLREDNWRIAHEQESAYASSAQQLFQKFMLHEDGSLMLRENETGLRREFSLSAYTLSQQRLFEEDFAELTAPPFGS